MGTEKELVQLIVVTIVVLFVMTTAVLFFFFFFKRRIIKNEKEKRDMAVNYQKELLYKTILVQENERKRIAQDLHDEISSKLNVVSLNTNLLLETENITLQEQKKLLESILQISGSTLETSRKIAHDLLPPILDKFGLLPAVQELADSINQSKKVRLNVQSDYIPDSLSKEKELHLFRILQELINNSIRHGKASAVTIHIGNAPVLLTYTDNGKGVSKLQLSKGKGLGMKNIESRAAMLEGSVTFESEINKGVTVKITL